jgi:Domain of unknown function (DUF222)/HNH endonuclease
MDEKFVADLLGKTPGIEVLVELVKIDPMTLSASARVDYLAALEKQGAWLQALMQVAIVAVAGTEPDGDKGLYSTVDDPQREEIATTLNVAPVTAQSRIDVARVLTQHLPATCTALANGEISSAQATVIAKESASLLRRGIDPDQLKYLESTAIAYAEFHTPAQVTNKVRSIVAKMEPVEFEVAVAQAAEGRRVTFTPQPHGMAQIMALLPAVEAQTVWLAIDKLARANKEKGLSLDSHSQSSGIRTGAKSFLNSELGSGSTTDSTTDSDSLAKLISMGIEPLTLDQLRADALATIAESFLAASADENLAHGRPVTLNLTLDLPTFLGLNENPGVLAGYGEIPASAARLLAKDAKWRRFITDPVTGNLLDYGRLTYQPPQPLVDFIVARDRRCRFPGCRQPARVCDIDHAIPWEEGGKTSKENLGLLCRRHHRMKTHGGWELTSFEDGSCEWKSPEGNVVKVAPRSITEVA